MTLEAVETLKYQITQAQGRIDQARRRVGTLQQEIESETTGIESNQRKIAGLDIALKVLERDQITQHTANTLPE